MQIWPRRVIEEANLFNPAFCATLLAKATEEFVKRAQRPLPFALSFLVLPIVLHQGTRLALPRSTVTSLLPWVQDNPGELVGFSTRTRHLRDITREAVMFGIQYQTLTVTDEGAIALGARRQSAT